ncbi:MAG TPA: DinB family protein [Gemmatimonadaceae bacterium]|nr:DinB family protein [Gemmatimonadaceae bacterium]
MPINLASGFLTYSRWLLVTEYPAKLRACLEAIPADAIWRPPAPGSNAIGNLLLHLNGNVRQWIVSGVGGAADVRERDAEFATREGASAEELMAHLEKTLAEADAVLARLTPDELAGRRSIQGREVSVLEAVYHVTEHFAMHTGQIILLAKMMAPGTIRFHDDTGGLATPVWRDGITR